jgi:DNA repair protein RadC
MFSYTIHDLDNREKPRERLINTGADSLSDTELLAIILRVGGKKESVLELARKILLEFGGFHGLIEVSVEQLLAFKNIGFAKAVSIKALCEIALRINLTEKKKSTSIKTPEDVFKLINKELYGKRKEKLYLISLDARNKVISKDVVSIGTISEALVHPREVYKQALLRNAVSIILVHNHPSSDTTPSTEDILVTERVAQAGVLLGVSLVDHIIVSDTDYCSLKALNLFEVKKLDGEGVRK